MWRSRAGGAPTGDSLVPPTDSSTRRYTLKRATGRGMGRRRERGAGRACVHPRMAAPSWLPTRVSNLDPSGEHTRPGPGDVGEFPTVETPPGAGPYRLPSPPPRPHRRRGTSPPRRAGWGEHAGRCRRRIGPRHGGREPRRSRAQRLAPQEISTGSDRTAPTKTPAGQSPRRGSSSLGMWRKGPG